MFRAGDYVVYGYSGVCQVEETTKLSIPSGAKPREYYSLLPLQDAGSRVFTPVDSDKVAIRGVMSEREALALIDSIPEIEPLYVANEKFREAAYKEAMRTCDYKEWIRIIKTLRLRRMKRVARGKQSTSVDSRYLRSAENYLYTELAVALRKDRSEVESFVEEKIKARKKAAKEQDKEQV